MLSRTSAQQEAFRASSRALSRHSSTLDYDDDDDTNKDLDDSDEPPTGLNYQVLRRK
jgi:hypothetical protein